MKTIGQKLSPILYELEMTILEHQVHAGTKPEYPDSALTSATHIFMSVLMDKMWNLSEYESMSIEDRCNMARQAGTKLAKLIKTYTNMNIKDLINNE